MRDRGTFNFSGNLEVKKDAPLEARSLVNSYADLVKPETWTDEQGGIWKYDCMLVSCKDRPGKVYQLSPGADYTKESSWILIGDTSELNNKVQEFIDSKGAPNGLASLNESGIIPSAQLPSYVDDVIEVDTFSNLPGTGESGKIYIVQDTNLTYRWSGTGYVEISKSLALGETSSTAYPGDKGKATTDKLNKTSNKVVVGTVTVNPSTDKVVLKYQTHFTSTNSDSEDSHTINAATTSQAGVMTSADKTKLNGLKDQAGITSDIDAVQTNLETHINNKSNPHEVTKDQVGLGNVDNTSDANKPISSATQNALNSKFNASDGNALKQTIENMPNLVVTEGRLSHKNDRISLSLTQQDLKDQADTDSILLTFNPATDSTAGIILPSDKTKIDKIITNGNGTKYLSDNGTYKEIQGGSADIESLKKYIDDSISSARSVGYMMQLTEIDASGLDENTWYPVTIAAGERKNIRVEVLVSLDSGTKPSWSTHERGFSVRKIWEFAPYAWGVNSRAILNVYLSDFNLAKIDPVRGLSNLSHFDTCYVYVRGGGKYHFYASHEANVILHTDTYHAGDQSISPTTDIPDPIYEVDWDNYGKVIDVPDGSYLTINKNVTGTEAIEFINNIFGSTDRLKEVVKDIIENHQRYLFHSYASNGNCLEVSNVYAYYEYSKEEYDLQYNVSYYTNNGPVSKRTAFKLMPNNEDCVAISEDLLPDWGSIKNVIYEGNEFNFADDNIGDYVWINYRSRSNAATSAKAVYIGNGQAGADGKYGAVHASGFFKESDIRLKSDIAPLKHTLDQICEIPTVEFNMHDKHQIGTIAQDLENNFAEVVNTDSDGMKSVDYCMLGVVAIEGIKLLKQEVEDLKKQIEELKNGK